MTRFVEVMAALQKGDLAAGAAALARESADVMATRDFAAQSADGWTALHLAGFLGQADVAKALLAAGADHTAVSGNATANQPLHAAIAGAGDAETICVLMEAGASVRFAAGGGWTPLHLAASRGNVTLCDALIARGALLGATSDDGKTPADIAAERGHGDLAARLRG